MSEVDIARSYSHVVSTARTIATAGRAQAAESPSKDRSIAGASTLDKEAGASKLDKEARALALRVHAREDHGEWSAVSESQGFTAALAGPECSRIGSQLILSRSVHTQPDAATVS